MFSFIAAYPQDIRGGLQKEINALNQKINGENEQIEALQESLKKTEANQGALGREMRECENRLSQVQVGLVLSCLGIFALCPFWRFCKHSKESESRY